MRLINADALIAEMHNVILEDGEDRRTFYEVIERQHTIDPVSIETKNPEILQPDLASIVGTEEAEKILAQAAKVGEAVGELISQFLEALND